MRRHFAGATLQVTSRRQDRSWSQRNDGGDFETTIDRTAHGMNDGIQWGFPKYVRLVVQVEAVKQ